MATHLPNGVSLEDCLTNTFLLAETILLRWRRYEANPLIPVVPEQDPVLSTYSCLLDAGYLCAWQRTKEVIFKNSDDTPPKCEKELWVFWYDKEPKDLKDKIHVDLNANDSVCEDSIKYEYKTVFYKALHNAIERHLLKQNYVKLDKWFLKPLDDISDIRSNKEHLSFCFSFFLHGDSNVCASVDITRHFPVRRITAEHVSLASRNPNSINVMLAPHCLKATLTGVSYKSSEDSAIVQLLEEWNRYYPIKYASVDSEQNSTDENSCTPSAVEVLVGDVVMCYPSWMVLISSPEDPLLKTSEVKATNMIPSLATNAGKICKRKGAILTSNQLDRNAHLMINSSFKHSKLQPYLRSGQTKDPLVVSNLTFMSSRVEALNRTCLCCNTKDFRKIALLAASRKEKYSSLHSNSSFHQRSSHSQKKASNPPTSSQENRLNSEVNSQHNASSVTDTSQKAAINLDPGSYPIMNELLGPSTLDDPLPGPPPKSRFPPSVPEPPNHFQVDTPPEEEPEESPVDRKPTSVKLYYAGKYKSNSSNCYHPSYRIETVQKPDFVSSKGTFSLLDKVYQLVDNPNAHGAFETNCGYFGSSDSFNSHWLDQNADGLFGPQVSESVYDFDDRYDDSLSSFESTGLTFNPSKRGRGNSRKGSVGRGKDQLNQQLKKQPGKKRKTKNDGDASLETMSINNINSPGNSMMSLMSGTKPKTPPGKTQLVSPSLTTAKSLELTKAEFVENTFESSDDEDHLPALPIFNPENDHQPPSVKPPDSVELARMFPTPPSNNPLELGPSGGGSGHTGINSPQTNSSSLLLPNGDKLLHSYEQSYGAGGGADLSQVLAAAGLATSTALVEQNQPPAVSTGGYQTISNLADDSPNMSLEVSERLTIVQNTKIALHMLPNDYCCLDLSPLSPPVSSTLSSPNAGPKKKRWKPTQKMDSDSCPSSSSGGGTSGATGQQQLSRKSSYNPSKSFSDARRQRIVSSFVGQGAGADDGGADTNTPATKHGGLVSTPGANEFLNTSSQNPLSSQSHETLVQFGMTPLSVASSQSPATPYSTMHTPGGSNSAIGAPFSHGAPTDITSPMSVQSSARTPFGAPGGYPSIGPLSHLRGPTSVSSFGGTHSLLVNLYLSDSLLNLFTDINFDSCVICNCNMTIQSLDASLHLSGTPLALDQSKGILCECGFRALRNRHLAAGAGLFGEDEYEVVNRYTYAKDRTILPWQNSQSLIASINSQLTSTCSLLPRFNLTTFLTLEDKLQTKSKPVKLQYSQRLLDGRISLKEAILFARYTVDNPAPFPSIDVKKFRFDDWLLQRDHSIIHSRGGHSKSMALAVTGMGREIKQVCTHFASDSNKKCDGPLTWAQFYKASGDFTVPVQDLKPLPVPSLLVGSPERQNSSITPFAIHQWEKLFLEPFSGSRTVLYLTICPDDKFIIKATELFLKEMSSVYQTCQLGLHVPVQLPKSEDSLSVSSGICVVSKNDFLHPQNLVAGGLSSILSTLGFEPEWWNAIGDATLAKEKLLLFSSFCQTKLPDLLRSVNVHLSLSCAASNSSSVRSGGENGPIKEEMGGSGLQDTNNIHLNNNIRLDYQNGFQDGTSPFKEPLGGANCISGIKLGAEDSSPGQQTKLQQPGGAPNDESSINASNNRDNRSNNSHDNHQPTIVVYVIDPFAYQSSSETSTACFASSLAFIKCFENVLEKLPSALRNNCVLQVLPLSAVETVTRWRSDAMSRKLLKSYCFSVYSKCSTNLLRFVPCKSLTTFGPSADKDCRYKKYGLQQVNFTPPYVLQSLKLADGGNGNKNATEFSFRDSLASNSLTISSQDSKVLFVTYCLSHDHRWILVCCTDMIGEILLVNNINIEAIPSPSSKKKTQTKTIEKRRPGLEKLWEFVLSIISKSAMPWRIVIGRFGRLGHGEIKDWHIMLSKPSLAKYSQSLKSLCTTCKLQGESCNASILSACLVSMESACHLQLFHDEKVHIEEDSDPQGAPTFGPETGSSSKKGSQSSLSSSSSFPLSHLGFSPSREVSATHVLVMPTSANTTTQVTSTSQYDGTADFGFTELFAFNEIDPEDIGQLMNEISNDNNGSGCQAGNDATSGLGDTKKEVTCSAYLSPADSDPELIGQLLQQQPLALGFYVSTAPTGHLPAWFWSSDPLSEFKSPSTLKAALHITTSMNDDRQKQSHPLDSHQTTTVLRHVLESYNALSWLNVDPSCNDRRSCLPVHMVVLVNMYHCFQKFSSLSPHEPPFLSPTMGGQHEPNKS